MEIRSNPSFPRGQIPIAMPTEIMRAILPFRWRDLPPPQEDHCLRLGPVCCTEGVGRLKVLREAGLSRHHVGLEIGDDVILRKVKKGTTASEQVRAGRMAKETGIELSEYVILGLGESKGPNSFAGDWGSDQCIEPDFVRAANPGAQDQYASSARDQ